MGVSGWCVTHDLSVLKIDNDKPNPTTEAHRNGLRAVKQQKTWAPEVGNTPIYEFLDCEQFKGSGHIGVIMGAFFNAVEMAGGDSSTVLITNYS